MAGLMLKDVSKRFGTTTAVDAIDLDVRDGEFVALLGPSGCGKTTLLRLIAGFEPVDGGTIAFAGSVVSAAHRHVPPERRRIGMVFQSYALWPHMTVAENVGYALRVRRLPRADLDSRVGAALSAVGLSTHSDRRPASLSGGQRQRVALARCLASDPAMVLLDEPLANLDVHLRDGMQQEFRTFHAVTGATMVYVTHDQAEAMALADRIAVMDQGRIQQIAPPRRLYAEPETPMVAAFVGRGMVVPAVVHGQDGPGRCRATILGVELSARCRAAAPGHRWACLRAEDLRLGAVEGFMAEVKSATFQGDVTMLSVRTVTHEAALLHLRVPGPAPRPGDRICVGLVDAWIIPGR